MAGGFGKKRIEAWRARHQGDSETALWEAVAWDVLSPLVQSIEPAEDLGTGGVDFRCLQDDKPFYVETTCIKILTAEDTTGVSDDIPLNVVTSGPFRYMTQQVRDELRAKASQCAGLDAPCLVLLGTFHGVATAVGTGRHAVELILTGGIRDTLLVSRSSNEIIPRREATFTSAAFARLDAEAPGGVAPARRSISGVLLCDPYGRHLDGLLHHDAARPFDRALLPAVAFCELRFDHNAGTCETVWSQPKGRS